MTDHINTQKETLKKLQDLLERQQQLEQELRDLIETVESHNS